jgi:hypothetical protein
LVFEPKSWYGFSKPLPKPKSRQSKIRSTSSEKRSMMPKTFEGCASLEHDVLLEDRIDKEPFQDPANPEAFLGDG